jgi:hypothetical protein
MILWLVGLVEGWWHWLATSGVCIVWGHRRERRNPICTRCHEYHSREYR